MFLAPLKRCDSCGVISRWEFTGFTATEYRCYMGDIAPPRIEVNPLSGIFTFACRQCNYERHFRDLTLQQQCELPDEGYILSIRKDESDAKQEK